MGESAGSIELYNPSGVTMAATEITNKKAGWSQPASLTLRSTPVEVAVSVRKIVGQWDEWRARPRTALCNCSSATARLEDRVVPSHQVDTEFLSDRKAMSIAGSIIGRISCTTEVSDGPFFHRGIWCCSPTNTPAAIKPETSPTERPTISIRWYCIEKVRLTHPYTVGGLLPNQRER